MKLGRPWGTQDISRKPMRVVGQGYSGLRLIGLKRGMANQRNNWDEVLEIEDFCWEKDLESGDERVIEEINS